MTTCMEPPTLADIGDQQQRQSELLLSMAQMLSDIGQLCDAGNQFQSSTQASLQDVLSRLDRLEKTLQVGTRHTLVQQRSRIRCLFLIHHPTAWSAIREVVDVMRHSQDFEPVVMSLPHRFPMLNTMGGEQEVHAMLQAQGYPHVRIRDDAQHLALDHVKAIAPAVVFRQAPWDHDLPGCLSADRLSFTRLCYVPYGYMTARIEPQQFDQQLHRLAWRIFCPDEAHRQMSAQHNLYGGINCRVTGYPKFDHLARHAGTSGSWPLAGIAGQPQPYRLIWAPHFTFQGDWLKFGVFDQIAADMVALARAHPSALQIVMRPHPALREAMLAAPSGSHLSNFLTAWMACGNTALSTEQEYADLFAASDAMLTDGLSFFSEYQLFDKPLVFFERDDHMGFNAAGQELLPGMYRVTAMSAFASLLQDLRQGRESDEVAHARHRIAQALRPFPGQAAVRIVDAIRQEWAAA
jgi:hypothetical protein